MILPHMSAGRADIPDAAVQMIVVVPTHELRSPLLGSLTAWKAAARELRTVLGGAEQALDKRIVVTDPRPVTGRFIEALR